jgi:hypothetical protein
MFVNLVTPKAGAEHELSFNKPALGLNVHSSHLVENHCVQCWLMIVVNLVTLLVAAELNLKKYTKVWPNLLQRYKI